MEDPIVITIILVILIPLIIFYIFNNFGGDDINWISGDEKPKVVLIPTKPYEGPNNKDLDTYYNFALGFIILIIFLLVITNFLSKKEIKSIGITYDTNSVIKQPAIQGGEKAEADTSIGEIVVPRKITPEDVKFKLKSYFNAINNRQFFDFESYFAPVLPTYFSYKNVTSEFASNDVFKFWSDQKQPSRIYFENSNFTVFESFNTFEISGNIIEQSSLYSERVPYWIESEIKYIFDSNLKIISLSGTILNKSPDLVRIFEIEDATVQDIKERENINDFKKYFNLIYETSNVKPSVSRRYINAVKEVYGPQLLIYFNNQYYSFEEYFSDRSRLNIALFGIKSVKNSSSGAKVVTISF